MDKRRVKKDQASHRSLHWWEIKSWSTFHQDSIYPSVNPALCFEWFCEALLSISGPKHRNYVQGYVRGRKGGWEQASIGGVSWETVSLCLPLLKSPGCPCEDLSSFGRICFEWWYLSLVWLNHLSVYSPHWVCGAHTMAKTHSGHSKSHGICVSSLSGTSPGISWMYQQLTAPSEFPD